MIHDMLDMCATKGGASSGKPSERFARSNRLAAILLGCWIALGLVVSPGRALAQAVAGLAPAGLDAKIERALSAARPALLSHVKDLTAKRSQGGALALVLLAAIHDGVDPSDPIVAAAAKELSTDASDDTYDLALRLMVMKAMPAFPDRDRLAIQDARALERCQHVDGGFGYEFPPFSWDLSNAQYGALGLRAAAAMGVPIDRSVWHRLATKILRAQERDGGWGYSDWLGISSSYPSMTVAGIGVLAICHRQLANDSLPLASLERGVSRGWSWIARSVASIGNLNERSSFYFHYGLERAGILSDVQVIGGRNWYEDGAGMFCASQLPGGGWHSSGDHGAMLPVGDAGDPVSTAFAVLFLRRKFEKTDLEAGMRKLRVLDVTWCTLDFAPGLSPPDAGDDGWFMLGLVIASSWALLSGLLLIARLLA